MASDRVLFRFPLTPMQEGMAYNVSSGREPGVEVEQMVWALPEDVDVPLLQRAWREALARHDALRTRFRWGGEGGVQEVLASVELPWAEVDASAGAEAPEATLDAFLRADRLRGIDLGVAPLMRLTLFRFGARDYRLVWTFSHAALDGRAFTRVVEEVLGAYDALRAGAAWEAEPAPPFRAFAEWMAGRDWEGAEAYWRRTLEGIAVPTPLGIVGPDGAPLDDALPDGAAGGHLSVDRGHDLVEQRCSRDLTAALHRRAEAEGVTVNTLVQAVWAVVLNRYSGDKEVVFGAIRACRKGSVAGSEDMVGVLINTVPVRAAVPADAPVGAWLRALRARWVELRPVELAPLARVQRWAGLEPGVPLFESLVVFEGYELEAALQARGGAWAHRRFELHQQTGFPLTLYGYDGDRLRLALEYDLGRVVPEAASRMLGHVCAALERLSDEAVSSVGDVAILSDEEANAALRLANDTARPFAPTCVHDAVAEQARKGAERAAVVGRGGRLTYGELDARVNQLARHLRASGIGRRDLVGVHLGRSVDLPVALLAVLRAGAAYVPLDPTFPDARLAFMAEDAGLAAVVTEPAAGALPPLQCPVIDLAEARWLDAADAAFDAGVEPDDPAYVIYTSGSTGRPKGVVVEHRNVAAFFDGMDDHLLPESDVSEDGSDWDEQTWLAVTSVSFDISVLELLWTLARGCTVVVQPDERVQPDALMAARRSPITAGSAEGGRDDVAFSLFYFASDEGEVASGGESGRAAKYDLLLDGARFADAHGFEAVWTPERHFHAFGGLYPNPSVVSAALAAVTERVHLRAGSCVSPLHHPARVAEEWAVVDNLSGGRVGISFAAGWQPRDFLLRPEGFADRKGQMLRDIETVRALWRGEERAFPGHDGEPVTVRTLPRPVQADLPVWITAAGNPETFREAGERGYHVLTHLLGQRVEDLAEKVAVYREARRAAGHDPAAGRVTLMLHAFVGDCDDAVREAVRAPMKAYLRSSIGLIQAAAWAFPTFRAQTTDAQGRFSVEGLSEEALEEVLDFSFERYFETSALFGSASTCRRQVERVRAAGVNEVACLVDFGVDADAVRAMLPALARLREDLRADLHADLHAEVNAATTGAGTTGGNAEANAEATSVAELIRAHGVTHLQCTPTQARLLAADPESLSALGGLECLLVGGEALPSALAAQLKGAGVGRLLNVYGPTEATVWSSAHLVTEGAAEGTAEGVVPIGRPLANERLYVLDAARRPVPVGITGELWIAGAGVARGYLGRADLTAERFVPDPFVAAPLVAAPLVAARPGGEERPRGEERMYRTGDLARRREDGAVEFVGRVDTQVKVRGYRIELGEVEAALEAHPALREAAVVVREDVPGDIRLVAYIAPLDGAAPSREVLRDHLSQRLPTYMMPDVFVPLERLPLTPNQKVDRKALPAPDAVAAAPTRPAPTSRPTPTEGAGVLVADGSIEDAVARIWRDVLHVDAVAPTDNFFDLGGHSLLAMQVQARLRADLGRSIRVVDLFRSPTVRALATHLAAHLGPEPGGDGAPAEVARSGSDRGAARRDAMLRRRR